MTTSLAHRYTSKEAAAKVWAAPYHVVGRPGGYLHTPTAREYAELPTWLQGPAGGLAVQVQRLYDSADHCRSVHGWHELATVLIARGLLTTDVGPRGGRTYRLAS